MKKFELIINKDQPITAISIVDAPAVEENFICLNKQNQEIKLSIDEQRIITGPALIPDKLIYRNSEFSLGECEVFFSAETIKEASKLFLSGNNVHNTTIQHEIPTEKLDLAESWVILDKDCDKAKALGFDLPVGTWMVSYYVPDVDLWNSIKAGNFNGFSIESSFSSVEILQSENKQQQQQQELLSKQEKLEAIEYLKTKITKQKIKNCI